VLVIVGLFALVALGSLSSNSSVNAVSISDLQIEPTKTFDIASLEEFTASSFTDTYNTFTDDAYATDGLWSTAVYETSAVSADYRPVAYWSGFDSGGVLDGATITQVDIVIRLSVSGTNNDEWGLILANLGSDTTLRAEATGDQSLTNLTYTDVNEPDNSAWSATDVQGCQIDLDYDKVTASDNFDIYIYEVCFKVTYTSGGTDYEKNLTETATVADVRTNEADFDRSYTETVTAADVKTTVADFVRNLVESIGVVGALTIAKLTTKDMIESISASDVRTTAVAYARNQVETISIADILARGIGLNMSESVSVVDVIDTAKFIMKDMIESISASDVRTTAVAYARNLTESISAIDAQSNAAIYVRDFVEAITVSDIRDIVKNPTGGEDYEKNLTEEIGVGPIIGYVVGGTLLYQLFFSLNMWGYLGPIALVIVGYIASKKDRFIGLIFIIVKSLIIAIYLTLVTATPGYWWHVFILILGVILITGSSLSDG